MKKFLILATVIICSLISVTAANNIDVIIKTNSEKIEALIQEVSDTEIRYKKANNPNGPMFVIKLSEISSILYANGEVQAIEHTARPVDNNPYGYIPNGSPNSSAYGRPNSYGYTSGNQLVEGGMQRVGENTYSLGGKIYKGKELEYYLQQTCPQAYTYYENQKNLETTGYCFLGIGVPVCLVMGVTMMFCGDYQWNEEMFIAGCFFTGLGGAMTLASVPMIACGNINKKRVDEVYNLQCARRTACQMEFKLTSGANGLGLALSF